MATFSLTTLLLILLFLLLISAFFSGSETGMMAANRYRLRHKAKQGNRHAKRVLSLLERPDRLLGVILIGNTFSNNLAASIATLIAVQLLGEQLGVAVATVTLTLLLLIFSEVTPKTFAALYPEKISYLVSWPMKALLFVLYPLIFLVNGISNGLLKILGIKVNADDSRHQLTSEEIRNLVNETGYRTLGQNKKMLLRLLDLNKVTVDDIMVPRSDIVGLDLADSMDELRQQLRLVQHTRLPIFRDDIDELQGIIHTRSLLPLLASDKLNEESLLAIATEAFYVPEGTPLPTQLMNFKTHKNRIAFVVDEYGDIQGLVTLEDILEEVVGEFTTDIASTHRDIKKEAMGSYIIDASITIRELNRTLGWSLPIDGPKTLNGLILEYLESIPPAKTGCRISGYPMDILQIKDNAVKHVRVYPMLKHERDIDMRD